MTVSEITLRVPNPAVQAAFYSDVFGMHPQPSPAGTWRVGYPGPDADLVFVAGDERLATPADRYWKIALCMPSVDRAVEQLQAHGVEVSSPRQFRDIGYLCHLADPTGLTVELLQHTFGPSPEVSDPRFGGGAHLGLLTLRCADIEAERTRWLAHGQALLSVQPVPDRFTLHFFGYREPGAPAMPGDGPEAVARRPWLWQQPTTALEFKHDAQLEIRPACTPAAGLAGFALRGGAPATFDDHGAQVRIHGA